MSSVFSRFVWALCLAIPVTGSALEAVTVAPANGSAPLVVSGQVEAIRQGTLSAQVAGRVTEVLVRAGDSVQTGQLLIRIDQGDSGSDVQASTAAASGAEAQYNEARAEYQRAQQLRKQDYISEAAMQRAEAALHTAQSAHAAALAQASGARTRAGWHNIVAPFAGRVTEVWVSTGDLATPGKALVQMYQPGALRMVAYVPESLKTSIVPGDASVVVGDSKAEHVISWRIIPAVDPQTHSIQVRAELAANSTLEPGQFGKLLLPTAGSEQIRIPRSAVVQRSELSAVYVLDAQNAAHLRQLRLGPILGDQVVVLAGLNSGERVAVNPAALDPPGGAAP